MAQTCEENEGSFGSDYILLLILGQISVQSLKTVHAKLGARLSQPLGRKG